MCLEKRTSAASRQAHRLCAARLNPCPSFDSLFPSLLGSVKASGAVQIDQLKNLIWTGGTKFVNPGSHAGALQAAEKLASLKGTAFRVCVRTPKKDTAGLSTTLRSGRDDNSVVAKTSFSPGNAEFYPSTELSSRPERTRISCHAAPAKAAYAPFFKERRMMFANATNFYRKSGVA